MDTVIVSPRTAGEPEVDLTTFALIHRSMRADVRRLAALAAGQGDAPFSPDREAALAEYLEGVLTEIHAHHTKEDEILWPVITASAGAAIDLLPLTEDHGAIDPVLARIRAAKGAERARALAELRDLLDEHIGEEETLVFPIMREYVSVPDFAACEKQFRPSSPGQLKFLLPWIERHMLPGERERVLGEAGLMFRIFLRLFRPGFARLERRVFG